ncbi:coenzyme PQQ synthesis protein D [Jannaschia pagri]|uniref:Coenzyme PQQ synthesis protein D n=1 Tax=Jannaschia pagri TaxID=2829797 RepID=A0ABQ4NMC1_9RHOB|nr:MULTISPECIES: pyrroloquinoline quinone biosynthesis peptide chaperone PqqD [unclassified Jannaschia]GIT91725.1 coenzyme PQQ synthesis protein D [Jannaschia sp. AI_61]GIT95559.1 coenzyme PQQ synthesis protein D [Jannaschia sp. AI_62]
MTPVLPRGVRLHHDRVRDRWVLLAPERVIDLDPIGHAILSEIDGASAVGEITDRLAVKYDAPVEQIGGDVREYLAGLADRRFLDMVP